jgi:hypothetical protein
MSAVASEFDKIGGELVQIVEGMRALWISGEFHAFPRGEPDSCGHGWHA